MSFPLKCVKQRLQWIEVLVTTKDKADNGDDADSDKAFQLFPQNLLPHRAKVCLLIGALRPSNYASDGSAQTRIRAATVRQNLQIKLSISPSHIILTPSQPVPTLTL